MADKSYLITVDEAHVFSPHLTNEFIFATGSAALTTATPGEIAFLNSSANPFNKIFVNTGTAPGGNTGILALNISGYETPGFNEYFRAENDSVQFLDNHACPN